MLKRICSLVLFAVMVCCACAASAREADLFADLKAIYEGTYIVGSEMAAGEYVLFSLPGKTGSFVIAKDMRADEIVAKEAFETSTIVSVMEDDYLTIADCVAYRAEDFYQYRRIGTGQYGVMLKVGYDLEPGVYELRAKPGKDAECKKYDSGRHVAEDLIQVFTGEQLSMVDVQPGQYLQLVDCCVAGGETALAIDSRASGAAGASAAPAASGPKPSGAAGRIIMDCNLRGMPAMDSGVLAVARYGQTFELLESDDLWYKIRLEDGAVGWVQQIMAETAE